MQINLFVRLILVATATLSLQACSESTPGSDQSEIATFPIQLKLFIDGYIEGSTRLLKPVLKNQGVGSSLERVDQVTVVLHDSQTPYAAVESITADLKTDGTLAVNIPARLFDRSYYIAIKHRNALETWTANAVTLNAQLTYDFSSSANKAYGSNQKEIAPGFFAFFSGDVNQDGAIDAFDSSPILSDLGKSGNLATDLNGDGAVTASDDNIRLPNDGQLVLTP